MLDAGVPTARATRHTDAAGAKRAAHALGAPVVVKASGLAAGKGVVVAHTLAEAEAAIDDMLVANRYGEAGAEVLVEEFMEGEELSVFYLTDGFTAIPLVPAQDHKRLLAGDQGPNTGGMGAYAPVTLDAQLAARGLPVTAAGLGDVEHGRGDGGVRADRRANARRDARAGAPVLPASCTWGSCSPAEA
jgi:phosphoribosylamine-glycine ligase